MSRSTSTEPTATAASSDDTQDRDEYAEREEPLDDVVASAHRVGEHEFERAPLLLTGNRPGSGADREDQQHERCGEREDLTVEVPGRTREVELAAREQRTQRLGRSFA